MNKQVFDEEQEGAGPNWTLIIVGYFAVLSVAIVILRPYHLSMGGIFFAMLGSAIALALVIFLVKSGYRKFRAMNLSVRDVYDLAIGYNGYQEVEANATAEGESEEYAPIIEDHPLKISKLYQPSVRAFFSAMVTIIGMRRSGKSTLLAVLAEELAMHGLPFVLFDTESEYAGLVSPNYLSVPVLAGMVEMQSEGPGQSYFMALSPEGAYTFGQDIMNYGRQVVVDLKSYGSDEDAATVMAGVVSGIEAWQQARPDGDRVPVVVLLDESQKWFPQSLQDTVLSKEKQGALDQAFYGKVVARGGKRGFGLVVAAQRYSQLNNKLMQSQHRFLFKQTEQNDMKKYADLGIPAEDVASLEQGQCYVFGPSIPGWWRLPMRNRKSPHMGNTPGLENLARYTKQLRSGTLARSYATSKETVVLAPPIHEEAKEEPKVISLGKDCTITLEQFEVAVRMRKVGMSTGYRDLMPIFGLSEYYAKELNKRLREALGQDPERESE